MLLFVVSPIWRNPCLSNETAQPCRNIPLSQTTWIRSSPYVTHRNIMEPTSAPRLSIQLKSSDMPFRKRSYVVYPVHRNLFKLHNLISEVDYLYFPGMFVPNWPTPLIVPLGKVIFFSLLHKHWQKCVRSVDVSLSMTSIPDLEVRR